MIVREAEPAEHTGVGELLDAAFTTGCWVTPEYRAHLHRVAERAATWHVWVATDPGSPELLAAVLTPRLEHYDRPDFTFSVLGVGPAGRGRGLGRVLVDHALDLGRQAGFARVAIRSSPQMTAAHRLYLSLGFSRRVEDELAVVDSGQRLYAFTRWIDTNHGEAMSTVTRAGAEQAATHAHARPSPASSRLELDEQPSPGVVALLVDPRSPFSRVAAGAVRLWGLDAAIDVRAAAEAGEAGGALLPALVDTGTGALVCDDAVAIVDALERWGRGAEAGSSGEAVRTVAGQVRDDVVDGAFAVLRASSEAGRDASRRVFFARLAYLDYLLTTRTYLGGEEPGAVDLWLFAALVQYDVGWRRHFPWGDARLQDYPRLWAYAREVFALPGAITAGELAAIQEAADAGILVDADGPHPLQAPPAPAIRISAEPPADPDLWRIWREQPAD